MDIVVRARQEQLQLADSIRGAILSVKPDIPHFDVSTVESEIETLGNRRRFQTWLLNVFSAVALVLAAVGDLWAVLILRGSRLSEIGIRMALGADRLDIMRMIFRQLIALVGSGLFLGLAGALVLARVHLESPIRDAIGWMSEPSRWQHPCCSWSLWQRRIFRRDGPQGWIRSSPYHLNNELAQVHLCSLDTISRYAGRPNLRAVRHDPSVKNRQCTHREPNSSGFQRGERGFPNLHRTIALLAHPAVPFNSWRCLNAPS